VNNRESINLERASHKLKGSVSIFGGDAIRQSVQALETMGRDQDLDHAGEVLARLEDQMAAMQKELFDIRQQTCQES
jgi:HPt (histidine-containing phosphotransfer) domain-containing protein